MFGLLLCLSLACDLLIGFACCALPIAFACCLPAALPVALLIALPIAWPVAVLAALPATLASCSALWLVYYLGLCCMPCLLRL